MMPFDTVTGKNNAMKVKYLDPWSFYDYKERVASLGGFGVGNSMAPPSWVGPHARRLNAYMVLESYYRNMAREWLNSSVSDEDRDIRREYGDPYLVVEAVLSSLLGNDQKIVVEGATSEGADESINKQQELLDEWAKRERLKLKLKECERNAVKLGDGVYVLGWSETKKRPVLHVYDPGFYFPVLDTTTDESEFPEKIHIAYEFEDEHRGQTKKFIRRITWWLSDEDEDGNPVMVNLPWNTEASTRICMMRDMTWLIEDGQGHVENFMVKDPISDETTNLGVDFIPVIHIPNTVSLSEHFGVSSFGPQLQIFDDLVSTDTDLQISAALVGSPVLGVGGAQLPKDEDGNIMGYGPGTTFETGDGKLDMLDTSRSLDALLKYDDKLLDRMSVNTRTPGTLLGRVDPSKVQSGIVLTLSFAPHSSMIGEMRLVRDEQYALMLKFVCRFYMKAGVLPSMKDAKLEMGSYLPADRQEAMGIITNGMSNHSMSRETAVRLLIEAGYPIEDIQDEIMRINKEDFSAAGAMLDATGDIAAVRERLGLPGQAPGAGAPTVTGGPGGAPTLPA